MLPETRATERAIETWQRRAARTGHRPPTASFHGRRVLTLESRRAPELALLVVNYGGVPMVAPALREVPLESNTAALDLASTLLRRECDLLILTTGIGTRLFVKLAAAAHGYAPVIGALASVRIAARGPKPVAALREIGLPPWITAPSPNTWRELVAALDAKAPGICAGGTRVAVQEYGAPTPDLVEALEARGARVTPVPIYRWALPENCEPLQAAVRALVDGSIDVVLLTASVQLLHLLEVAGAMGQALQVRRALERVVVASIGPMTSDELRRQALPIDMEPSNPKMGFLVKEVAERCGDLLQAKRPAQVTTRD